MGLCLQSPPLCAARALVQSHSTFCGRKSGVHRQREGERWEEEWGTGGRDQVKKWYSQIPTVVHFFGYRCR